MGNCSAKKKGKIYTKFNPNRHLFNLKTKQKNNFFRLASKLII